MSAHRCCTAWNEPIGLSNCTRSFAYSTASSSARCRGADTVDDVRDREPVERAADGRVGVGVRAAEARARRGRRTSTVPCLREPSTVDDRLDRDAVAIGGDREDAQPTLGIGRSHEEHGRRRAASATCTFAPSIRHPSAATLAVVAGSDHA